MQLPFQTIYEDQITHYPNIKISRDPHLFDFFNVPTDVTISELPSFVLPSDKSIPQIGSSS